MFCARLYVVHFGRELVSSNANQILSAHNLDTPTAFLIRGLVIVRLSQLAAAASIARSLPPGDVGNGGGQMGGCVSGIFDMPLLLAPALPPSKNAA